MAREVIGPPQAWVDSKASRPTMSYEEWRSWGGEGRSEWVDGEAIVFVPTTILHARIVRFLLLLLARYVDHYGLGEVLAETVEMRLPHAARVPDVLFVARRNLDRLTPLRLMGPADLVVEVVSEDSVERDRVEKFDEYAAAGIPEYWLVDARPDHRAAEFYRLEGGTYRATPPEADGFYRSRAVPGFSLRPEWPSEDPLPDPWSLMPLIVGETGG